MKTEMGALTRLLASLEVARIELEYVSADLSYDGLKAFKGDSDALETLLAKLRLARTALTAAQETLDDAVAGQPVLYTLATGMAR